VEGIRRSPLDRSHHLEKGREGERERQGARERREREGESKGV